MKTEKSIFNPDGGTKANCEVSTHP